MAAEDTEEVEGQAAPVAPDGESEQDEPKQCVVCRGEKKVKSNLGGETSIVDCPWCEGTGKQIPEHNAQSKWLDKKESDQSE